MLYRHAVLKQVYCTGISKVRAQAANIFETVATAVAAIALLSSCRATVQLK